MTSGVQACHRGLTPKLDRGRGPPIPEEVPLQLVLCIRPGQGGAPPPACRPYQCICGTPSTHSRTLRVVSGGDVDLGRATRCNCPPRGRCPEARPPSRAAGGGGPRAALRPAGQDRKECGCLGSAPAPYGFLLTHRPVAGRGVSSPRFLAGGNDLLCRSVWSLFWKGSTFTAEVRARTAP